MADFDKSTFDPKAAAEARKKELDQMAQKLEAGVRKLLLPDGALILPVIPDRIILVKDNKTSNNRLKLGRTSKQRSKR